MSFKPLPDRASGSNRPALLPTDRRPKRPATDTRYDSARDQTGWIAREPRDGRKTGRISSRRARDTFRRAGRGERGRRARVPVRRRGKRSARERRHGEREEQPEDAGGGEARDEAGEASGRGERRWRRAVRAYFVASSASVRRARRIRSLSQRSIASAQRAYLKNARAARVAERGEAAVIGGVALVVAAAGKVRVDGLAPVLATTWAPSPGALLRGEAYVVDGAPAAASGPRPRRPVRAGATARPATACSTRRPGSPADRAHGLRHRRPGLRGLPVGGRGQRTGRSP